jgi:hypothetical protein
MFWPVMQLGMHAVAIAAAFMVVPVGRRGRGVLTALVAAVPLTLYGARSLLFLPIAVTTVLVAASGRMRRPVLMVAGAGVLLLGGVTYVGYRGFSTGSFAFRVGAAVAADLFPEMRTTAMVRERLPVDQHVGSQLLSTAFSALAPSQVLRVVGLDKSELFRPVGRDFWELFAREFETVPGLRAGLLGELYIGFGTGGVFLGVALLCIAARLAGPRGPLHVPAVTAYREAWLGVLLGAAVIYGTQFVFTIVFVGVPALLVARWLRPAAAPG